MKNHFDFVCAFNFTSVFLHFTALEGYDPKQPVNPKRREGFSIQLGTQFKRKLGKKDKSYSPFPPLHQSLEPDN